jgi:precorrin-2 methylase
MNIVADVDKKAGALNGLHEENLIASWRPMNKETKTLRYKIAWAKNPTELSEQVNQMLDKGFALHGDLMMYRSGGDNYFMQPLIKLELS